jgi:integrase
MAEQEQPKGTTLNSYIEKYISDIKTGKRLTEKGTRFRPNTFKNFTSFKTKFDEYQKEKHVKIDFQHVTIDFHTKFTGYFTQKDYKLNTVGRHIKTLKTLMKAAKDEGLHENTESERKQFKVFRVETDEVYLTETELQNIIDADLTETPHLEKVRDVFLTGCYTSQRYSDYGGLNKTNIKTLENGTQIIELFQAKTGQRVNIPINPELTRILTKYDYKLPKTYEQKVNVGIKKICEKAKITEPVLVETIQGGLKVKKSVPKWTLIKSHTARRTGATLMYLGKVDNIAAMKITGHTTERDYLNYIKIGIEENAQTLALHPYFMGSPLKLVK